MSHTRQNRNIDIYSTVSQNLRVGTGFYFGYARMLRTHTQIPRVIRYIGKLPIKKHFRIYQTSSNLHSTRDRPMSCWFNSINSSPSPIFSLLLRFVHCVANNSEKKVKRSGKNWNSVTQSDRNIRPDGNKNLHLAKIFFIGFCCEKNTVSGRLSISWIITFQTLVIDTEFCAHYSSTMMN